MHNMLRFLGVPIREKSYMFGDNNMGLYVFIWEQQDTESTK
jgi:hypothetical protein